MFPNSANASLTLISIVSVLDSLGVKKNRIVSRKEVVGSMQSITSSEYQTSTLLNIKVDIKVSIQAPIYDGSKYVLMDDVIYKIERTYINGQFIELYLVATDLKESELL